MRLFELDDKRDYKSPLPVIQDESILDDIDDITSEIRQKIYQRLGLDPLKDPLKSYQFAQKHLQNKYGKEMNVPIKDILLIEPTLSKAQLDALMKGKAISSSDLPLLYKVNNQYIAMDGNHRIVASYLNKERSVKALVLDISELKLV